MSDQYSPEEKREEFKKYLEKGGLLESIKKIIAGLYEEPEKPNNALDLFKQQLCAGGPVSPDIEALKQKVTELKQKNKKLREENNELKHKLAHYEPPTEDQNQKN